MTTEVLLICGSCAALSHTRALVREVADRLERLGAAACVVDAAALELPVANPHYHHKPHTHPDERVRTFVAAVEAADAVVLASPVYHGSYSGVLKNSLDHLPSDAFRNKAVGLISHGGGSRAASSACDHLRAVVRTLYGYATQTQVLTGREDFAVEDGTISLANPDISCRLDRLAQELAYLAMLFADCDIPKED